MASNRNQPHKTISRWQLLELIGLGQERGLEGSQIRQVLASEYGVNPDYTSRLLVDFVQKGYVTSQAAPPASGAKGGRNRKVYIRTDKANDLADKPIPRSAALMAKLTPSALAPQEATPIPASQEEALTTPPIDQPLQQEIPVTEAAPPQRQETTVAPAATRRRGRRPLAETAASETPPQQSLPYPTPEADAAREGRAEPSRSASSTPVPVQDLPCDADVPSAPTNSAPSATPETLAHEAAPSTPPAVHDALTSAVDQFSDLLLLQVAQKLGTFVANQMAPLEQATTELCTQIDVIRARLDAMTQQLSTAFTAPVAAPHRERPPVTGRSTPGNVAPAAERSTPPGQGRGKVGKQPPASQAERKGNPQTTMAGSRKLRALLIGVPGEQEQALRERFGARYDLLFLGADARFGKVRAIKDKHDIVLGLEETCSSAIKDALKGHPHKAVLPHPAQLMDELEEYFQLHQEQSQGGSAG
ncbi:hypothetical protein QU487_17740 [Crenobacter sp. SG2305]|uniref:hypothetical protein n=1 Tax=Crenobacter oryzisoli TaxID=3056844 RepID=UPI0025AB2C5F|nr:hypothetical protein [Crenobacter sp. SG2305]MDN0084581.1 hypothetical protein [Crenobacter sp. SG2305]